MDHDDNVVVCDGRLFHVVASDTRGTLALDKTLRSNRSPLGEGIFTV